MQNNSIDVFTSKEFRFLQWLTTLPCIELNGRQVVRMSQSQLAEAYGVCATTIFHWIEELKNANCIEPNNKKSGYIVTGTGREVIAKILEIEKLIGGKSDGN